LPKKPQRLQLIKQHESIRQYAIGKGHSVSVMWRGGEVDTVFGFEKEGDALQWIKEKSQAKALKHRQLFAARSVDNF
jgi:hypothetical protein